MAELLYKFLDASGTDSNLALFGLGSFVRCILFFLNFPFVKVLREQFLNLIEKGTSSE